MLLPPGFSLKQDSACTHIRLGRSRAKSLCSAGQLRLTADLEAIGGKLDAGYKVMAEFMAEIKLDDLENKLEGDQMKQLLSRI